MEEETTPRTRCWLLGLTRPNFRRLAGRLQTRAVRLRSCWQRALSFDARAFSLSGKNAGSHIGWSNPTGFYLRTYRGHYRCYRGATDARAIYAGPWGVQYLYGDKLRAHPREAKDRRDGGKVFRKREGSCIFCPRATLVVVRNTAGGRASGLAPSSWTRRALRPDLPAGRWAPDIVISPLPLKVPR